MLPKKPGTDICEHYCPSADVCEHYRYLQTLLYVTCIKNPYRNCFEKNGEHNRKAYLEDQLGFWQNRRSREAMLALVITLEKQLEKTKSSVYCIC